MELGRRIAEIRKEHDLTQEGLAEICSVTRQTISNWENGKSYPDLETLVLISDTFDVSLDALLKGDRKMVSEITKEQKHGRSKVLKIAILVVIILALVGYAAWFFVPRQIIPEGAENFRLGLIGGDGHEADQYIIVGDLDNSDWYRISEEGQQKLFDALKGKTMRAELPARSHYGYTQTEDRTLRFSIQYSYKGGEYDMFVNFWDVFRMRRSGIGGTMQSPWDPASLFETRVVGTAQNKELYAQIMDIVNEYGTLVAPSVNAVMNVESVSDDDHKAVVSVRNDSDTEINFPPFYRIQKQSGEGVWTDLPLIDGTSVSTILYSCGPGEEGRYEFYWPYYEYPAEKAGKYRMIIEYTFGDWSASPEAKNNMYCEFEIAE